MPMIEQAERIQLSASPSSVSVTLHLGGVKVSISMPPPAGVDDLSQEQGRNLVFRHARRALEVAREELE
jgi:hypothetical protein